MDDEAGRGDAAVATGAAAAGQAAASASDGGSTAGNDPTSGEIGTANRPGPAVPAREAEPLRRNRDFLLLWSGQVVSSIGSSIGVLVYPLLALAATGSAAQAGIVGSVGVGASMLLMLPAGVWVDRHRLKPMLVTCDLIRAAMAASIAVAILIGRLTLTQLIVAAAVSAACAAVFNSAQTAMIRHVVPARQLPQAFAQDEARAHIARLTGQPVGGYLYGVGAALPVLADALSFVATAGLISLIRPPDRHEHTGGDRAGRGQHDVNSRRPMWRDIGTGLHYVWRSAFLRTTLLCSAGINVVFAGLTLVVVASQTARGAASVHLGIAFGMGAVGGLLGALASVRIQHWLRPSTLIYCFGWTVALALVTLGRAHATYAIGALVAVVYFVTAPANSMLFAAQIRITPPDFQGRVVSASFLTIGVAAPLGPLLGGFLIDKAGQAVTFAVMAATVAVFTIVMQISRPIRAMRRPGED